MLPLIPCRGNKLNSYSCNGDLCFEVVKYRQWNPGNVSCYVTCSKCQTELPLKRTEDFSSYGVYDYDGFYEMAALRQQRQSQK